jgi:hypothetical protein
MGVRLLLRLEFFDAVQPYNGDMAGAKAEDWSWKERHLNAVKKAVQALWEKPVVLAGRQALKSTKTRLSRRFH